MSAFIYVQAKRLHPQNTSLTMCVCVKERNEKQTLISFDSFIEETPEAKA